MNKIYVFYPHSVLTSFIPARTKADFVVDVVYELWRVAINAKEFFESFTSIETHKHTCVHLIYQGRTYYLASSSREPNL